jgi:peptidoglycan/LPS O-acetylase OafA/YrhL
MSDPPPTSDNTYGRLTGWKRLAIVALGAISGAVVALMFSVFSGQPTPTWELILGTLGGALLGLSASLGE